MLCLGWWELYFMLECFDVYRERLRASLLYALFPETIKLRSWIINFVSPLEAVPESPFQSVVLRALHLSTISHINCSGYKLRNDTSISSLPMKLVFPNSWRERKFSVIYLQYL